MLMNVLGRTRRRSASLTNSPRFRFGALDVSIRFRCLASYVSARRRGLRRLAVVGVVGRSGRRVEGGGEREAADAPLRAAIHENPQMKPPDSLVFPGPVVERFLKVRDSLVNEIRAAEQARYKLAQEEARQRKQDLDRDRDRLRQLERLAEQESVVVRNRRVLSFVPFGVGQIQNREETLGYTLMASQVIFGGLSIAAIAMQSKLATEGENQARDGNVVDNAGLISGWGVVKRASAWTFVALAVGGVVQAQFAYVPEFRETRPRRLPPAVLRPATGLRGVDVTWLPSVSSTGAGLDLVGRF